VVYYQYVNYKINFIKWEDASDPTLTKYVTPD
jgi:hypothetical protein